MKKRYWVVLVSIFLFSCFMNVASIKNQEFCDYYVTEIFPVISAAYASLTSHIPFSLGELLIVLFVILSVISVCILLAFPIFCCFQKFQMKETFFYKFFFIWFRAYLGTAVLAFLLLTLNCFPLYHATGFEAQYMNDVGKEDYSFEQLACLRDYIATRCNTLSLEMQRDEEGNIIYEGDMNEAARESMEKLGHHYNRLSGFYSSPKALLTSNFMCQQSMRGYYFPFSMEANYNDAMTVMQKPSTMCHELAHTKGFILEDEANLIGFLACIGSDDKAFQYSGYLSVLNYIDNDFYKATGNNKYIYRTHVKISSRVRKDNQFITEATEKKVEEKAVIKTAVVKKAASDFIDTNLVMNGIPEGALSYNHVVGLLLEYYDDNLTPDGQDYLALSQLPTT